MAAMTEGPPPPTSNADHDARIVPLGGDQIGRFSAALADGFTLDGLRQLLRTELTGDVSVTLDAVVSVPGRTLVDVCHDLVLWALHDARVGIGGLLAAALRANPASPPLRTLQAEWEGVTFVAPSCPYPGMQPFTAAEQERFYGRAAEIAQAVDHLRRHRFLAVIGSSGSGKSSLLAAGILPELARSHYFGGKPWDVRTMRPGAAPSTTLAALWDLRSGGQAAAATSAPAQPAPAQPSPEALQ
jgi:hypothetical protein